MFFKYLGKDATKLYDKMLTDEENTSVKVDLSGVIGLPPTTSQNAEYRPENNPYGVDYLETFINNGNFVAISAGRAKLMPKSNKKTRQDLISSLISSANDVGMDSEAKDKLEMSLAEYEESKLFGWTDDMSGYWVHVNNFMTVMAKLSNVDQYGKACGYGSDFSNYDWGGASTEFLNETMSSISTRTNEEKKYWAFVPFYSNGIVEVSETMGNTTSKSSVEGAVNDNPISAKIKEATFLNGNQLKEGVEYYTKDSNMEGVDKSRGGLGGLTDFITGKSNKLGINVVMPEVYNDSETGISYTVKIKASTPIGHPLGSFLHPARAIAHCLPLVLPIHADIQGFSNGYLSPYIVRIFSKGMANCSMGMVTGMTLTRHTETNSVDGLLTDVDIELQIRDIYSLLGMPAKPTPTNVLGTVGLMGFLGTLSGFNMNQPDLVTFALLEASMKGSEMIKLPQTIKRKGSQVIRNLGRKFFTRD